MKLLDFDILGIHTKHSYYIQEDGQVFSSYSGKYLGQEISNAGYLRVNISMKHFSVHRLVAMEFIPNPESKPEVNHKDHNPLNNHVDNLEWMTRSEQMQHRNELFHENMPRGETCNFHKLNEKEVYEICDLIKNGFTSNKIAKHYNVTPKSIRNIKNGKTWKHINPFTIIDS